MLLEAKSPIVIAGQGVLYAEATDELLALADLLDIPVMTTTDGKSAFPEDHALALGSGGVVYTGHGRQFLLDSRCDLRDRHQPDAAQHLDPDHPAGQDDHPCHQRCARPATRPTTPRSAILGDAKLVLAQLIEAVKDRLGGKPHADGARPRIAELKGRGSQRWEGKAALDRKADLSRIS